jgi:hypothetical protein
MKRKLNEHIEMLGGVESINDHPVSLSELSRMEKEIGAHLPNSYRWLIGKYGAFDFKEGVKFVSLSRHPRVCRIGLSIFFGSKADGEHGLLDYVMLMRRRLPPTVIPICVTVFGDLICLGIKGKEKRKVFFWDHENEPDIAEYLAVHGKDARLPRTFMFRNLHVIAKNFDDFIVRLRVWKEADLPIPPRKKK